MPRRRGREFESRSRKRLRLPAAPAHCQPLGPGRGQLQARPRGTPLNAPLPSARQEVGAEPPLQREGGEREGEADQEFFLWVETGRGWNPAIGGFAGAWGNFAAQRPGAGGKGCGGGWAPERLMINARRWGKRAAPPCQARRRRAEAPGQSSCSMIQRGTWWRSPWCHRPDITAFR